MFFLWSQDCKVLTEGDDDVCVGIYANIICTYIVVFLSQDAPKGHACSLLVLHENGKKKWHFEIDLYVNSECNSWIIYIFL